MSTRKKKNKIQEKCRVPRVRDAAWRRIGGSRNPNVFNPKILDAGAEKIACCPTGNPLRRATTAPALRPRLAPMPGSKES